MTRKSEDLYCVEHSPRSTSRPRTFQCSSDKGAVLALPKGASVYGAGDMHKFETHASLHALRWYEEALNNGIKLSNGSVYFVTECTKSMDWGIAVFYAPSGANHGLRFIVDGESYRWNYRGKVEAKIGSQSTDRIVSDGREPNQCVFLRGYKIMLRSDIWAKVTMATNVTSQPEGGGLPSAQTSSYSGTSGSQTDSFLQSIDSCNAPDSSHRRLWQANELTHMQVLQGGSANSIGTASEPGQVILEEFFGDRAPVRI